MTAENLIVKKRDKQKLNENEIRFLVNGFISGEVTDYQMAALLMAIYFNGMTFEETCLLTQTMIESGERVNLDHLNQFPIDKHSTGGVGDKVSIVLAPLVATAGVAVPMMSGRGLGHSGGTLDKLEAIPGFRTDLSLKEFVSLLEKNAVAMIGQTHEIVPADQKIYALRDSTGTVPSIPLIVASILSKKIAEGAKALVLDVKTGKGAFFREYNQSLELAKAIITTADKFNVKTSALMTAMDQPLGFAVGNWLETREAILALQGQGPKDLIEITLALGAEMLIQAGVSYDHGEAHKTLTDSLSNGRALEKFIRIVELQGGDVSVVEDPDRYPRSRHHLSIRSNRTGFVHSIDALKIGLLSRDLGAGRRRMSDDIDYSAGIVLQKKQGDQVEKGESLAQIYYSSNLESETIKEKFFEAVEILSTPNQIKPLILKHLSRHDSGDWDEN